MFIATSAFLTDPLLAETALARAVAAGYRGPLFNGLAARIAFGERRFVDALSFGWPNWSANQRLNTDTLKLYYRAAMLGFKPEQGLDLAARYPDRLPKDNTVADVVAAYRAMPKSHLANPIAELDHIRRTRIHAYRAFVPADRDAAAGSEWYADLLNRGAVLPFDIPSSEFTKMILMPGFANVAFSAHFDLHNTDKAESHFAHSVAFGLYDVTTANTQFENPKNRIMIKFLNDGPSTVSAFGFPKISLDLARPAVNPTRMNGTIRMVILHNRCEVTLDDRRIFYGPVIADESNRRYGFFLITVGLSGSINPPVFEQLDDPRPGK
jgi:hypothetical protein